MSRKNYIINDLVQNPGFRRMVEGTATPEEISQWDSWIEENDQNRMKAISAMSEIIGFTFNDPNVPDLDQKWSALYAKTAGAGKRNLYKRRGRNTKLKWILRVAAVGLIVSLAGLGGSFFYYGKEIAVTHLEQISEEKTITTAGDDQKTLRFSNGSKIILGRNSILTYRIGVLHDQAIDVFLEGEAWFDVESDPSKDQPVFTVNTPGGIIRDIGTKFMVTVQNDRSRVVLQEGYVEVESVNQEGYHDEKVWFRVKKGEMVEFNRSKILRRQDVNSTLFTSWATGFIQFNRTNLQELAAYVEQRFDAEVQIVDQQLTDVTLDGAAYFRSLEGLVQSVSEVTSIPVYQSEDRNIVYIGNPNE